MKKLFAILTATLLVVACGGGNSKNLENQLKEYVAKMEKAFKAANYEEAIVIYLAYEEWVSSLDEEQLEELMKIIDKNVESFAILDEVGSSAYHEDEPEVHMVYSNCFDGYLNVRAEPSTKSQVVGTLRNGPEGAELISIEGKWTKVRVNGIVGYIWTADTQSYPSDPVYISSASVIGDWLWVDYGAHINFCYIKSNGKFEMEGFSVGSTSGKWRLSGNNLILINDNGKQTVCAVTHNTIIIDGNEFERE